MAVLCGNETQYGLYLSNFADNFISQVNLSDFTSFTISDLSIANNGRFVKKLILFFLAHIHIHIYFIFLVLFIV